MKDLKLENAEQKIQRKQLYAQAVFGNEEKRAVLKSLDNSWLASGPRVRDFEETVSKLFGKKYGVAVNSGSSANLLAVACLGLEKGSEVITPGCTFATTVFPLYQNHLVPVFVDVVSGRYTINEDLVESAITERTKAIMAPHLMGAVLDMPKLRKIANDYNLILIEDSCDTVAPRLNGTPVSVYSDLTTTSFYGSHVITAMGMGGMIMADDENLVKKIRVFRDWGRAGGDKEAFDERFDCDIDGTPYDHKFLYTELGYNLKMIESAAAFGLEQVKKLPQFTKRRNKNLARFLNYFKQYENKLFLPQLLPGAETIWLALPLTIRRDAGFTRYDFLKHMESFGIQTRVLFSGNITRHPVMDKLDYRVVGNLDHSDLIMSGGFLLGCHHGMNFGDVDFIIEVAEKFLSKI